MSAIATWYSSQYSTWNRTRRLRVAPFVATPDTNTSRQATNMASTEAGTGGTIVINMNNVNELAKDKKQDTLFGPNIGIVSPGPDWASKVTEKVKTDELTPEIVKNWIEKSKEAIQPTTTLQALVNLKRPTLKLSPLELNPSDDPSHPDSHHHHALEFEYDCDAPKCGIYVDVILSPEQKPDDATSRLTVFESTFEGGFGRLLKLEDGATLELGRFEHRTGASEASEPSQDVAKPTIPPTIPEQQPTNSTATSEPAPDARHERKRRFTGIHFRKRTHGGSVSGPALTVMDVEANSPASETTEKAVSESKESEEGVRVLIRLVALDEQGAELSSANEQSTYLHVVRLGAAVPSDQDDTRPWVVKVVKREATIGPHTFHLQEIYGLSSSSSHNATPPVPALPSPTLMQTHTYPPIAPPVPTHEDEPSSECLLCLSSPREVVLLPCRHLVACKECAVNMIEFGAGGTITHSESDPASESVPAGGEANAGVEGAADGTDANVTVNGSEGAANGEPVEGAAPAPAPVTAQPIAPVPQNPRRKRRAKGWFCPVCRQPYTSLLRITTTPPASSDKYGKRASTSTDGGHPLEFGASAPAPAPPPAAIVESPSSRGFPRPSFLRGLSRNASARAEASPV